MTTDEQIDELLLAADNIKDMSEYLRIMNKIEELLQQRDQLSTKHQ